MKRDATDTARAVVLSLLVHAGIAALFLVSMWWSTRAEPADAAGGITAGVVGVGELSAAMQRTLQMPADAPPVPDPLENPEPLPEPIVEPEPEPLPEPPLVEEMPQDPAATPAPVEREEVVDQPTPNKATETKVQDAQRRQPQADPVERERQQAQQRQQALAAQKQQQLADVRRRRAAASAQAQAAESRLAELTAGNSGNAAEESARADAGASGGDDSGLKARYAAALQEAIRAKWTRPDSIPSGAPCRLIIRQLIGGEVVGAEVVPPCVYDEQGRRSIEAAVRKAQPLPYAGFEKVFDRTLILNFRAP